MSVAPASVLSPLRVALLVFASVTGIVIGDTAGKLLVQSGVSPFLVAWARFAVAGLVLLPLSGLRVAELRSLIDWRVMLRAAFIAAGIASILNALRTEALADVFGAFFIGPIVSYVLAIVFLGERPSAARGVLLGVGFAGVMLVVKPGFGGGIGMIFALMAGTFYGAYLTMTRAVAGGYRPRFLLMSQLLIGTVLLAPLGLSAPLPTLGPWTLALFAISAAGSGFGNYLLVQASRRAEASLIAPLIYSQLVSAVVLGAAVFGEWPDLASLCGLVLIAGAGFGSLALSGRGPGAVRV